MKRFNLFVLTLFTAFLFTNCSVAEYFSLYSDEENVKYEMGRQIIEDEDDIAYSSLSFEKQDGEQFVFYLYVTNKSESNLETDPINIYMKSFDENRKRLKRSNFKIRAVNPEIEIRNIDEEIGDRENEYNVNIGFNIVFSLFNTIADLTDDDDNDVEDIVENAMLFTGNQIIEEQSYDNDVNNLNSQKEFWKNEVLRKTTLYPGQETGGLVYIPINKEAKFIKIFIALGETLHSYKFRQVSQ